MDTKLDLLKQIANGMTKQFGPDCEIVIHDLTQNNLDNSIVYIENGHVSGRRVGDGPSTVVLETVRRNPEAVHDKLAYLTRTSDGKVLKSSTMFIRGDDGNIDYIFAVNYDITGLLLIDRSLKSFINTEEATRNPSKITHNVNDLLDELLIKSVELVGKPVSLMNKEDKILAIQFLNDAGAFLITRSSDKVSKFFGISKYTLYSYIDVNKNVT
ncbi:MAG TPA: transcriptional regulator [Candidatus Fimimorpha faecalis]|uniref:Transcriptional regulator n=1 Tax=Candidatus Fimimorpha faecalis TaxID=2840824 RepID=A0A9D1JCX4_9FIRM|nr:transcriptional regulator [Candidatus Fimimorpha faecalis]